MSKISKNISFAVCITLTLSSCQPTKTAIKNDQIVHYIMSVQDEYQNGKIAGGKFYCLLNIHEKHLDTILKESYSSKYSFYQTIYKKADAKCILDYNAKYWSNSCVRGKLNSSISSQEDSTQNSLTIDKLHDSVNYSYKHLDINNKDILQIGLYIGLMKVSFIDYCKIYERGYCDIPSDTIVILKKGFTVER
jgi:hypothetical protein